MTTQHESYQIKFTEFPDYLYVEIKGTEISVDIIASYIHKIVEKCEASGKNRILLYRDIPAVLSEGEVFYTVNQSLKALEGKRVALVNPYDVISTAVDFGMTVGQNRGGNYRSFKNVSDAEAWLLKGV